MRWRIIIATILFLMAVPVFGQNNTTVTATVVGSNTAPWANATAYAALVCPGNEQPYIGTFPIPRNSPTTKFDANGTFSQVLYNTSVLVTVNGGTLVCNYQYHITDQCGQNSFITNSLTGITGSGPVNLSSQINATAPAPCVPGGQGPASPPLNSLQYNKAGSFGGTNYLYNPSDTSVAFCASTPCASISANTGLGLYSNTGGLEILATAFIGGNVTDSALTSGNCVQAGVGGILGTSGSPCASGSATVSSFSAGNLSPLFTTSVATPTTTPALSFAAVSQSANLFYASPNGSSGVPTFRAIASGDVPTAALPASTSNCAAGNYATGFNSGGSMICTAFPGFTKVQFLQITSGICTVSGGAETTCSMGPFNWPSAFASTSYAITCTPTTITGTGTNPGIYSLRWTSKSTTQFSLVMQQGSASAAGNATTSEIDCIGMQ